MKKVDPIREVDDIEHMKDYLRSKSERNYILIMCGLYSGLRISDIIPLQVKHVIGDHIDIYEKKTRKRKRFPINDQLRKALDAYIIENDLKSYDFLFPSRKKKRSKSGNMPGARIHHISREAAYMIFKDAALHIGLKKIGTHSMRKTFGYHFYKREGNLVMLMKIFNHSTQRQTLDYIGYEQDEIDDVMLKFKY